MNIIPNKGLLSIGRNRNFEFDGIIQAGKFQLEGTDIEFDYEAFKLEVRRAESLRILAEVDGEFDQRGNPKLRWVKSVIEELTGTLEIDNPGNKSGWKSEAYPQFPVLTSREISNVYYDHLAFVEVHTAARISTMPWIRLSLTAWTTSTKRTWFLKGSCWQEASCPTCGSLCGSWRTTVWASRAASA